MSKPKHHQDPSYAAFAERYRTDIVAFAEEVLGLKVSPLMADAMRAYSKPDARVAITGNPQADELPDVSPLAPLGLWRLFFGGIAPAAPSVTLVGCPTSKLGNGNDYRRLALRAAKRAPWLAPYLHITGEKVYLDSSKVWEGSHILFLAVRAHTPENLAGFYCKHGAAWLMEEAHKVATKCLRVAIGSLYTPGASIVLSCRGEPPAAGYDLGIIREEFVFAGAPMPQSEPESR